MKNIIIAVLSVMLTPLLAVGQQFQVLYQFIQPPQYPAAELLDGGDGYFYGTTTSGGTNNVGAIFKITSSGRYTIIHNFLGPDGSGPSARLVRGPNGPFYGTTTTGGAFPHARFYNFIP